MPRREFENRIIQGDRLAVLKRLPASSVDLLLTDPPYGMRYRAKKWGKPMAGDGNLAWFPPVIREAYRVLKPDRYIYLFTNEHGLSTFREEMGQAGFNVKRLLVWVKDQHTLGDLRGDYANQTEYLLFGKKGRRLLQGKRDRNVLFCQAGLPQAPAPDREAGGSSAFPHPKEQPAGRAGARSLRGLGHALQSGQGSGAQVYRHRDRSWLRRGREAKGGRAEPPAGPRPDGSRRLSSRG